jgi:hypothetical protein
MHEGCVQAVIKSSKSLVKAGWLCSQSTGRPKYLTSQVFFMRSLRTFFTQLLEQSAQVEKTVLLQSNISFPHYPQSLLILLNNL